MSDQLSQDSSRQHVISIPIRTKQNSTDAPNPHAESQPDRSAQVQPVTKINEDNPVEEHGPTEEESEDENTEDDAEDSSSEDPYPEYKLTFQSTFSALESGISAAQHSAPLSNHTHSQPSPSLIAAHQRYYQNILSGIHQFVMSNSNLPLYLTSPPLEKLTVNVFKKGMNSCPCCLPDAKTKFVLEEEGGITKGAFVDGVAGYLFGDVEGLTRMHVDVEEEDGEGSQEEAVQGAVVGVKFDYMMETSEHGPEKILLRSREQEIWMYCEIVEM